MSNLEFQSLIFISQKSIISWLLEYSKVLNIPEQEVNDFPDELWFVD